MEQREDARPKSGLGNEKQGGECVHMYLVKEIKTEESVLSDCKER